MPFSRGPKCPFWAPQRLGSWSSGDFSQARPLHAPAHLAPWSVNQCRLQGTVRPQVLSSCSNASFISQGLEQLETQKGLNKLLQPEVVNTLETGEGVGGAECVWRKQFSPDVSIRDLEAATTQTPSGGRLQGAVLSNVQKQKNNFLFRNATLPN